MFSVPLQIAKFVSCLVTNKTLVRSNNEMMLTQKDWSASGMPCAIVKYCTKN